MEMAEKVLKEMEKLGKPFNATEVAKSSGIDKADVDKAFKDLKKDGKIVSPVRCKWEPAK